MFSFPIIPLFIYNIYNGNSLLIDPSYIFILFIAAIFCSWIASIASLIALREAPNQWYSLIVSKSYVTYTTVFAIMFLWAELSYFKIWVIIFILLFSAIILYDKKTDGKKHWNKWIYLSIYAFFARWNLSLIFAWLGTKGLSASIINLYLLSFVTIFILWEITYKKIKYRAKTPWELWTLLAIWLSFIVFQQSQITALIIAPNPGYINAVNIGPIGLITLLTGIIYKDHLSKRKLIWVAWVIISIVFLFV
jgi:hypothetical protein